MSAELWKVGRLPASEHSLLKYVLEQTLAYHLWMVFKVIYKLVFVFVFSLQDEQLSKIFYKGFPLIFIEIGESLSVKLKIAIENART